MNLKEIQAVEFIISRMNHDQRLVVEYNGKLLSADFLSYIKSEEEIYTLTTETNNHYYLEERSSFNYFANSIFYNNVSKDTHNFYFVNLEGNRYSISGHQLINLGVFKDVLAHVKKYSKKFEYKQRKEVNITPRNVEFIGTNEVLPFYLFPEDAEFTPVSIVDRELTFD